MTCVSYRTAINEGRTFAVIELGFAYKQVDRQSSLLVLDNVAAFLLVGEVKFWFCQWKVLLR